ncbi:MULTISPECIES: MBL fold metallo-hydrolase [Microbacterium]|uniref:MBL fold metallo-hydrolase n=1 Tax=Microbacterium TaxID=33882 RepID=UPI00300E03C3
MSAGWYEVAPGVHRLGLAEVNCYLVVTPDGMTLVDAGLPRTGRVLDVVLDHLGARRSDIDAVLFTHGHFDHVGMARRLVDESGTPLLVHPRDAEMLRHPYRYGHERPRSAYPIRYPRAVPVLAAMAAAGALMVRGVEAAPRGWSRARPPPTARRHWTPSTCSGRRMPRCCYPATGCPGATAWRQRSRRRAARASAERAGDEETPGDPGVPMRWAIPDSN